MCVSLLLFYTLVFCSVSLSVFGFQNGKFSFNWFYANILYTWLHFGSICVCFSVVLWAWVFLLKMSKSLQWIFIQVRKALVTIGSYGKMRIARRCERMRKIHVYALEEVKNENTLNMCTQVCWDCVYCHFWNFHRFHGWFRFQCIAISISISKIIQTKLSIDEL